MADTEAQEAAVVPYEPHKTVYCGVCTMPPEYCEYGGTVSECEAWLKKTHREMHEQLYATDLTANLTELSVSAQKRAEKDATKKAAKAASASAREADKRATSRITITRVERSKRKYATTVSGLEAFGLDLKKVAKDLGKKFATGSSVTKTAAGGEEIVVQGDVSEDLEEYLMDNYEEVPEDQIDLVEDKKKKTAA